jgi:anaerobic dimethyl sulfoxide reductase subunit C (anchor subunit)
MVQSAVGSVWCLQAAFFWQGGPVDSLRLKIQILAALGLVLAGLAAAMAHLGRPRDSLRSVKNFRRSWLSREIFSVNLLAGLLALMAVLAHIRPGAYSGWLLLVGSLAGGAALYAMSRVYRLRTVPSWNHAGTPLAFVGSALLLGGLLCAMVSQTVGLVQVVDPGAMLQNDHRSVALVFVGAGFILKLLAVRIKPSREDDFGVLKPRQPVLQGLGLALWMVSTLAAADPFFQTSLLLSAAAFMICGEIIHRIQFYNSYNRVGL